MTRNALIRQAIHEWLARKNQPQWPAEILAYTGTSDMPAFENERQHLA